MPLWVPVPVSQRMQVPRNKTLIILPFDRFFIAYSAFTRLLYITSSANLVLLTNNKILSIWGEYVNQTSNNLTCQILKHFNSEIKQDLFLTTFLSTHKHSRCKQVSKEKYQFTTS